MKRIVTFIILLIALASFIGCKKNSTPITISGYTATDDQGNRISGGSYDPSDWQRNASIPQPVINILDTIPLQTGSNRSNLIYEFNGCGVSGAYPNPASQSFVFYLDSPCDSVYGTKFILVDQNLHVYDSGSFGGYNKVNININTLASGLYRVYYIGYDTTGRVIYQGYGDELKN